MRLGRPKVYDDVLRNRLIDVAHEELRRFGCDGVSLRAVVDRAGTSTNAVYTLFGGREQLLDVVISEILEERLGVWEDLVEGSSAADALWLLIDEFAGWAQRSQFEYDACFRQGEVRPARRAMYSADELSGDEVLGAVFRNVAAAAYEAAGFDDADAVGSAQVLWVFLRGWVAVYAGAVSRGAQRPAVEALYAFAKSGALGFEVPAAVGMPA